LNQFDIRAIGGVAINGAPKDNATEFSIYPSSNGGNYSNIFLGNTGRSGGILISAGDESGSTSNDAAFYVDQYNGSAQQRLIVAGYYGVAINDPALVPAGEYFGDLNVVHKSNSYLATIALFPVTADHGYYNLFANAGGDFILERNLQNGAGQIDDMVFDSSGNLEIVGAAFKPGGGSWLSSSDRRIKQDIAPIGDAIDTVLRLHPISFHYTPQYRAIEGNLPDKPYLGFIAQEFAEVFPEAVTSTGKRVPGAPESDPAILALDPNPALITTVAAVQELAVENAGLRRQLDDTNASLAELRERLNRLERGRP
jgi:hypothetical protein